MPLFGTNRSQRLDVEHIVAPAGRPGAVVVTDLLTSHIWCCNPEMALCGQPMGPEFEEVDVEAEGVEAEDCEPCMWVDAAEKSCGARLCWLRNWWRTVRRGRSS